MRALAAILLALALAGGLLVWACSDAGDSADGGGGGTVDERAAEPPRFPAEPGLLLIGNDRGMIRPCGCSKPVLGGIERRMAFFAGLDETVRGQSLILAGGDLIHEGGRQQELKLESFQEAMTEIGVAAYCVGDGDLLVGVRSWQDILAVRDPSAFPLVSLNLRYEGKPLFATHAALDWAGRRVVVTSYVSPTDNVLTEPGLEVVAEPDLTAVRSALAARAGGDPALLVLYGTAQQTELETYARESGLAAAAARTLIVVRGVSDIPITMGETKETLTIEMGTKGRDVAWLAWPKSNRLVSYTLEAAYGAHPLGREILAFYRDSVEQEQLLLNAPKVGTAEGAYAGSEACATCHPAATAIWKRSRHAHAWQSLVDAGETMDPECVVCHVVDFDLLGGFDPVELNPVDVQCEACHGPSQGHIDHETPTPRGKLGERFCFRCHDLANSPKFDFATYWPKIEHSVK